MHPNVQRDLDLMMLLVLVLHVQLVATIVRKPQQEVFVKNVLQNMLPNWIRVQILSLVWPVL